MAIVTDHARLIEVWKRELESRKLRATLTDHEDRIAQRTRAIHQCKIRISEGKSRSEHLRQVILGWDTDIEKLHNRIDLVHQSVQMGNLQDPIAAERQIAQFQERIDDIELQYLEALEEQDHLELQEGIQQDNILNHQKQTLKITDALETIRPATLERLEIIEAETEALLDTMNPRVSNLYRLMNAKLDRAVAGVHQDSCGACFMKLPTELLWTAVHRSTICHCPYCSVFLIPEEFD